VSELLLKDPKDKKWQGPALIDDLAHYLRESNWIVVKEMYFPGWDSRIDVMAIKPHAYVTQDLRIYEVKTSRSDFHRDDGANKWRKYLDVAHRVFFACPAGVLTKDDMPHEAGLIVRGPKGWQVVKAAIGHAPPGFTPEIALAILFKVHNDDIEIRRLKERIATEENVDLEDKAKRIGREIRERLGGHGQHEIADRLRAAKQVLEVCREVTGLDIEKSDWRFRESLNTVSWIMKNLDLVERIGKVLGDLGDQFHVMTKTRERVQAVLDGKEVKEL
jgi:hypothetical protein